jgi:hypothetical protein
MDLLRQANAWLGGIRRASMETVITYRRGGSAGVPPTGGSAQVPATQGKTEAQLADNSGLLFGQQIIDWLIEVNDLVIPGISANPLTPTSGDQIVDTDNSVWEVMSPGADQPVWRWSGPGQLRYRIHTKQVSPV